MADEAANLIMEHLHILRRGQEGLQSTMNALSEEMRREIGDLKVRMSGLEMNLAHLQSQFAHFQARRWRSRAAALTALSNGWTTLSGILI